MAVLSKDIGHMDVLFHRGGDESIGVQWKEDKRDGEGFQNKDISDWSAIFEMLVDNTTVYSRSCTTTTAGCAICVIPGTAFTSTTWNDKLNGTWRILATSPEGAQEILGHGYYRIA